MTDLKKQAWEAFSYPLRFCPAYFQATLQKTRSVFGLPETACKVVGGTNSLVIALTSISIAIETYNRAYTLTQKFWIAAPIGVVTGLYTLPRFAASPFTLSHNLGIKELQVPEAQKLFFVPSLANPEKPTNEI